MEDVIMKVKPYKGKWVSRSRANQVNDMLCSAQIPDRTELRKQALAFEEVIQQRRALRAAGKNV